MSLAQTPPPSDFPYPKFNPGVLVAIESAIKIAWTKIKSEKIILSGDEDEVTAELQITLQNMMDNKECAGFTRGILQSIVRGANFKNYDGKHINKQPDLVFQLFDLRPGLTPSLYDAIFTECKIIGDGRSITNYIQNGVRRFVDGEYAWAMPYSMMIAYVRNKNTLPASLNDSYDKNIKKPEVGRYKPKGNTITLCKLSKAKPSTYTTIHSRKWRHTVYGNPGDIEIRHIWLSNT